MLKLLSIKVLFACVLPALSYVVGFDADPLTISATCFLIVLQLILSVASGSKKKKSSSNVLLSFPLQLSVLYFIQLWLMMSHHAGKINAQVLQAASRPAVRFQHANVGAAATAQVAAADAPPLPMSLLKQEATVLPGQVAPLFPGEVPVTTPRPAPTEAKASVFGSGFQLDAPLEDLQWAPKTISVVLPCAEEREFAMKTVQAVFDSTPSEILHEIVVVDDGSNPPLSTTHLTPDVQKKYKVLVKRHTETVGLIGAKKTGGDAATGDVIVFFDCHVGPQTGWYKDFLELIAENYRRMVIPDITGLDIDSWTQVGGSGMSKCYLTWDGDFKWGGTDDMYMGMLSGGLAGMSKRWWTESGGFDDQMFGWGGENIDQGIRMWVCGGEIVAAPHAQVAHMWRSGDPRTGARYRRVGDTTKNRARAMYAWYGEFTAKLDHYPNFARRNEDGGQWYGDMSSYQKVKDRLAGCHSFAWYLRRFKAVYEDAGIVPKEIFMIKDLKSNKCLLFQGSAGTSGGGEEGVVLELCDATNPRFFWHAGNRNRKTGECCSGLHAWNTDQCFDEGNGGHGHTTICELSGGNGGQLWTFSEDGRLKHKRACLGRRDGNDQLYTAPCNSFGTTGGNIWMKEAVSEPLEMQLYQKAQAEHPEVFARLNAQLATAEKAKASLGGCTGTECKKLVVPDGHGLCLDVEGTLVTEKEGCSPFILVGNSVQPKGQEGQCLDTWSDQDPETWGFYGCHFGVNQQFKTTKEGDRQLVCAVQVLQDAAQGGSQCFVMTDWAGSP